jgi:GT2 family glycosyltransferase
VGAQLSIVIPSFGGYDKLARALDGYERQDVPAAAFEVLVAVDRGDPDPAAAEAAIGRRPYPVSVVRADVRGASANRNAGWRAASAPLVLFADNDIVPEPRLVPEHLAWHDGHADETVAVLGHVRWADEVEVTAFMRWLDDGIQFDYPSIQGTEAGWGRFYSANVSLKRSFVERVGGFDETHFPYGYEDLDFGYRADELGMTLLYNRLAEAQHLQAYDVAFYEQRVRRIAFAEREFVRLHPDVPPFFFNLYSAAAEGKPASGRGRGLIGWLPRGFPVLGERAWTSADLYYRQRLAPHFLAAWEEAANGTGPSAPMVGELGRGSS